MRITWIYFIHEVHEDKHYLQKQGFSDPNGIYAELKNPVSRSLINHLPRTTG